VSVCVCMCVYVCVCVRACMHVCACMPMHTHAKSVGCTDFSVMP